MHHNLSYQGTDMILYNNTKFEVGMNGFVFGGGGGGVPRSGQPEQRISSLYLDLGPILSLFPGRSAQDNSFCGFVIDNCRFMFNMDMTTSLCDRIQGGEGRGRGQRGGGEKGEAQHSCRYQLSKQNFGKGGSLNVYVLRQSQQARK